MSFDATFAIRFTPPIITSETLTDITKPVTQNGISNVEYISSATEFDWTILPIPNAANIAKNENNPAIHCQFFPNPFLM